MRLFVAVNFGDDVRESLAELVDELSAADLPVRWTPVENLHLTLRWLGERTREERRVAEMVVNGVAAGSEPFEARFGTLGAFPTPRRPRVLWISVDGGARLRLLRDELERRFAARGLGRDQRSFRPHVTLGRARPGASPAAFRRFASRSGDWSVDTVIRLRSIELLRSRLDRNGARYECLRRAELGGDALPSDASGR